MADLSNHHRETLEGGVSKIVQALFEQDQSLGIAREALIDAFDREAEALDG